MEEDEAAIGHTLYHEVPAVAITVPEGQWKPAFGDTGDELSVVAPGQFDGKANELFGAT